MRRRSEIERPPMPAWVLLAEPGEYEAAREWAVANGYSPLQWLLASSRARRQARGGES
jgi:hypothetical protein